MKSLHSTNLIASLEIDPFTFTGLLIHLQRSKSGHATRLIAKTLRGHTLMTVDLSQSFRGGSLGVEVVPPVIGSQFIVGPKRSGSVLLFKQEELQGPHPRSLILQQMHGSPLAVIVSNS